MTTTRTLIFLLFVFCFLPISSQAQDIPSTIFGDYIGDAQVENALFGINETMPEITVALENSGSENDYILKIVDLDIIDIPFPIEMDYVIITPFEGGYSLSRTAPITFIIPELPIPPIPIILPEGGIFYNVPAAITLENSQIVDVVLNLNLKAVATITIIVPINITFNIKFEGALFSPSTPPIIITTTLPSGKVEEEYFATLEAEGDTPITWTVENGVLPTNLTLDSYTGVISGTLTEAGIFDFIIMASNASGDDTRLLSIEIEDIDTVGIRIAEIEQLIVYPNPTSWELRISNSAFRINQIEIFDAYGKIVSKLENQNSKTETIIDTSYLPAGIYFLRIITEKGAVTQKVVKY